VLGLGGGLIWVAGEAWLAEAAPPGRRGLYVGWFEASVGLGMMAGPALLPLSAALGVPVLGVAATMMGLATATAWRLRGAAAPSSPHLEGDAPPAWQGMAAPLIAIAVLSGLMETGITALLPSISMRLGATEIAAAWLGAFTGAGSALMQPPAGHLADRIGARRAALLAWAGVAAAAALLLATAADPGRVLHVAGFVFAGAGGAVYTIVIVELGQRLGGAALVKAIAALVIGYAAGTAAGPALGGAVFDAAGLPALAWMLLALAGAGFSLAFAALRRASPPPG
jgi:MFS family permease